MKKVTGAKKKLFSLAGFEKKTGFEKKQLFSKAGFDTNTAAIEKKLAKYNAKLELLQNKMGEIQVGFQTDKHRTVIVMEGWDAAGKGGAIRHLIGTLDPKTFKIHPISAPTRDEQGRHYLWRFWKRLPKPGEIAIFDRSWYGRVLVERVEGFATTAQWSRAFEEIKEFEQSLITDGADVIKFFIHITQDTQLHRFERRFYNPLKRWKLTEEDFRNRDKADAYTDAINDMINKTSTPSAPWYVISGEDKMSARLKVLKATIKHLRKRHYFDPNPPVAEGVEAALASALSKKERSRL